MDSKRDPHQHVLWSLDNLALSSEQVASFQGLEAKVVVVEVPLVIQLLVDLLLILFDNPHYFWVDHTSISSLLVQ